MKTDLEGPSEAPLCSPAYISEEEVVTMARCAGSAPSTERKRQSWKDGSTYPKLAALFSLTPDAVLHVYTTHSFLSRSSLASLALSSPISPESNDSWGHVCSCGLSAMEPPGRRSPWPPAPVGGRPVAGPAVVAASAARAGAARAGPPRHVLPLPHRRPQGLRPDEPGGVVQALAAAVPRHRAPRGTVPLQQHPGARQDVHVLVRSDPQGHHRRPGPCQRRAVQ
jgi:hypothetical protein